MKERGSDAKRVAGDTRRGLVERLVAAQGVRRWRRPIPGPTTGAAAWHEQHCELGAARREQHDVDDERHAAGGRSCGRRTVRHCPRISTNSLIKSRRTLLARKPEPGALSAGSIERFPSRSATGEEC